MAALSDITARCLNLLGADAQISTAELESLAQTRYESMYEETQWSRSIIEFTITLIAPVTSTSSDTVTVTNGSSTVTSSGTPFTSGMAGRQIQIGAEPHYFFIDSFTSTAEIELGDGEGNTVDWPRDTDSDSGWRIFQHRYALPAVCEDVIVLSHDNFDIEELDGGRHEADLRDPDRSISDDRPRKWWYDGENSSNAREIGFLGYPATARLVRGQCAKIAPTLATATVIDLSVPALVYGTCADAASMMVAKEATEFWVRLSSHFNDKYTEVMTRAIEKDNARKSNPRSIRRSSRTPRAHDHSYFPSHFTGHF